MSPYTLYIHTYILIHTSPSQLEFGVTPILSPARLKDMGYSVAAYPLTLLSASARAMQAQLRVLAASTSTVTDSVDSKDSVDKEGKVGALMSFKELQEAVGFNEYYDVMDRFGMD
jgi:2-methylisocitrate lyase-like PEP mutase family enzyme